MLVILKQYPTFTFGGQWEVNLVLVPGATHNTPGIFARQLNLLPGSSTNSLHPTTFSHTPLFSFPNPNLCYAVLDDSFRVVRTDIALARC